MEINKQLIPTFLIVFNIAFGFTLISSFLPVYLDLKGISFTSIGIIFAFAAIIAGTLRFPIGSITDAYGRKPLMILGALGYPIFAISIAFADTTFQFISLKVMIEIFAAIFWTAIFAYIYDVIKDGQEGKEMALRNISSGIGLILAPLVAGFVISAYGFNILFYLSAIVGLISLLIIAVMTKETENKSSLSLKYMEEEYHDIIKIGKFKTLLLIGMAHNIIWIIWFIYLPIYLSNIGIDDFRIGMLLSMNYIAVVITQYPIGKLIDKFPTKYLLIPGFFLIWISGYAFIATKEYISMLVSRSTMGIGFSMTWDPLIARLSHLTPKEEHGASTGIFRAGNAISGGLTSIAAGYLAEIYGIKLLLWGASSISFILAVILLFTHREIIYKGAMIVRKHHSINFSFPIFQTQNK